jgi:thiamine biosynthesis protein ThiI
VEKRTFTTLDDIVAAGVELFRERVSERRFAVRARRGGDVKQIPFGSLDVERELGRELLPYAAKVDLTDPEVTASVEIQPGKAYFFDRKLVGQGGLPIGVEGRAVSLISGGYDSAVASWLMLKRGVALDYLFCNLGGDAHREGVMRVVKVLADQWSYGYRPRLFEVDFAPVVRELRGKTEPRYWQVLLKRLMFQAAGSLARYLRAPGIVTGEAVGQVSSQTLPNLAVISCDTRFAVLRPLLGFNKDEIIDMARDIGTSAFSAEVDEYCAMLPRHPATQASLEAVRTEESQLPPKLIAKLVASRTVVDLRELDLERGSNLEVEEIPAGATILDLRSQSAHRAWHFPEALHLDFMSGLKTYRSFDRDKSYVLYCEVGQKSAHLAELLSQEGFEARHVKRGVRTLLRQAKEMDLLDI